MKRLGKILLGILATVVAIALIILAIRFVNGLRYPAGEPMPNPQDLSTYNLAQPGMTVEHIQGKYLNGFHLKPDTLQHRGVVVVFGGSEGSPAYPQAVALAQNGYEVLALFFFGQPNQKPILKQVPLEFFGEALDWIDGHAASKKPVTVIGTSKGAELGLLLSTRYDRIDNTILYAPGSHVYPGLDYSGGMAASSWTEGGKDVPYVDFTKGDMGASIGMFGGFLLNYPVSFRAGYETATTRDPNAPAARIPAERFKGNLVLFAGDDDRMWQSEVALRTIVDARPATEGHVYPGAGHIFALDNWYVGGMAVGGTRDANRAAFADSNRIVKERLATWHG